MRLAKMGAAVVFGVTVPALILTACLMYGERALNTWTLNISNATFSNVPADLTTDNVAMFAGAVTIENHEFSGKIKKCKVIVAAIPSSIFGGKGGPFAEFDFPSLANNYGTNVKEFASPFTVTDSKLFTFWSKELATNRSIHVIFSAEPELKVFDLLNMQVTFTKRMLCGFVNETEVGAGDQGHLVVARRLLLDGLAGQPPQALRCEETSSRTHFLLI